MFLYICKQVFKFIYAPTLESLIRRCAQSNVEGTVEVTETPYSYLQAVALMLPDPPGHFGIGAQEGLCVFAWSAEEHTCQEMCVLGSGRCL